MATGKYLSYLSEEALASLGSMEGLGKPPVSRARPAPAKAHASAWPGWLAAAVVTGAAYLLNHLPFPPFQVVSEAGVRHPLSPAILAILVGVLAGNFLELPAAAVQGVKGVVKRALPAAIVLTGAGLNLRQLAAVGVPALSITVTCMAVAAIAAWYFGRLCKLPPKTSLLIGAGTAVCGTSAIIAVAPLLDAEDQDVVLSAGAVNLLGIVLMLASPAFGSFLGMGDQAYGVWAGTTIHAVPQVVAAGFAFSVKAGTLATLVKLVRVSLLAPLVFVLAGLRARRRPADGSLDVITVHYSRLIPPFIWGFVAAALLNTLGLIPTLEFASLPFVSGNLRVPLSGLLASLEGMLLALTMAALGLEVDVRFLARVGGRALLTGTAACLLLCGASWALIRVLL